MAKEQVYYYSDKTSFDSSIKKAKADISIKIEKLMQELI